MLRNENRAETRVLRQQGMDCHSFIAHQEFQPSIRGFLGHEPLAGELPRHRIAIRTHDDEAVPETFRRLTINGF